MKQTKWDSTHITDQTGRVVIVTGSSSGIGFETARVLAQKGATVIIAVRNPQKGEAALQAIKSEVPDAKVLQMEVDLADLKSVRRFVDNFSQSFSRLDLLINNAGVMVPPYTKTSDGFELQFGTNHLGHFLLTTLLLKWLKETAGARVGNVARTAHKFGKLNFADLNWENRKYKKWRAYGDSKISNLYFTYELQRRLDNENTGILVTAAHPGWTATELQRHAGLVSRLNALFAQNCHMGALPTLMAALDEKANGGDFYGPSGFMEIKGYPKKVKSIPLAQDREIAKQLWEVSEKMTMVNQ